MTNVAETSEKQKNRRAGEVSKRVTKQIYDEELAGAFTHIIKKLAKVIESTKKLKHVIERTDFEHKTVQVTAPTQPAIQNARTVSHNGVSHPQSN